jgi:hypothetical protein
MTRVKATLTANRELSRNQAGLFQRGVGAVLIEGLHPARGHADAHKLFQFRHPDAALVQVRAEGARHVLGHVPAYAALFLRHTAAMNDAPARDFGSCDAANF